MDEKCETVNEQVEKFRHIFRALFHFQIAIHKNTLEIFGKIFEKKINLCNEKKVIVEVKKYPCSCTNTSSPVFWQNDIDVF